MSGLGNLRPSGGGRPADCTSFIRASATPRAALILRTSAEIPADWPTADGTDVTDAQLGHALGWVCEVRQNDLLILNPLGEGVFRAELPELSDEWIREVRSSESSAIYLLPETSDQAPAMAILSETAKAHAVPAASVRTSVGDDFGKMKPVGRNEPCPCGSGKKFKHCHG